MKTLSYADESHYEDSTEKSNRKKKKKKNKRKKNKTFNLGASTGTLSGVMDKYNQMETKSNPTNAFLKTLVDIVAIGIGGSALGATLGKFAPLAGVALSFGGHYLDDKSGLMRGIGISAMAHSMAKSKEYHAPDSTVATRFSGLKDDLLRTILIKGSEEVPQSIQGFQNATEIDPINPAHFVSEHSEEVEGFNEETETHEPSKIGEIDMSSLDSLENEMYETANRFEAEQNQLKGNAVENEINNYLFGMELPSSSADTPDDPDYVDFSKF